MPRQFRQQGIAFAYPDNWRLEEQEVERGWAVSVSSPGGALWCLTVHRPAEDAAQTSRAILEGLRQSYDDLDAEAVVETVGGQEMVGYDVNFVCLDLISTAQVRGFQSGRSTYTMLWQAEDREFARVKPVFEAMMLSLVRETGDGA